MKSALMRITPVTKRPYGTQQQWDRHVRRNTMGRIVWRLFKLGLVPTIIIGVLILAAAPLAFG